MSYLRPTRSLKAPACYTLIYDAACPFCTRTAAAIQAHAREPVDILPFDDAAGKGMLANLTPEQVRASVHFVTPAGVEYHGGEAAVRALRLLPGGRLLGVLNLPGLSWVREIGYDGVTKARPLLSRFVHP